MIYLDSAATSYPKPAGVLDAMRECMLNCGGNPGRGAHSLSLAAARRVFECRELVAKAFGAADSDRVFFTPNTTYGINAVIKGILRQGDHAIISDMEHNAVWRPIHKMASEGKIEYSVFKTLALADRRSPTLICAQIARLLRPNTRLVVCPHASNICSLTLPVKEIGAFCKKRGIAFVVDAAQSAGHVPIDLRRDCISALCIPGHKGLYGPQGSGAVVMEEGLVLDTLTEGGNGIDSMLGDMPSGSPERYEAGTVSTPCIAGLYEGLRFALGRGIACIGEMEKIMCKRLLELLGNTAGVTLYAPQYAGSIALFNLDGVPSERVAELLDKRGVCARGGYHCAALAHKTLGTPDGGAVRVSFGAFNKPFEIESFYRILREIIKEEGLKR